VQYVRYTDRGYDGAPRIFFEFSLAPGQTRLDPAIYAVMQKHKTTNDGYPTGLSVSGSGKLWSLPDHQYGRGIADRIDMLLQDLAQKLEKGAQRDR
jgi:hypothetical protein